MQTIINTPVSELVFVVYSVAVFLWWHRSRRTQ